MWILYGATPYNSQFEETEKAADSESRNVDLQHVVLTGDQHDEKKHPSDSRRYADPSGHTKHQEELREKKSGEATRKKNDEEKFQRTQVDLKDHRLESTS